MSCHKLPFESRALARLTMRKIDKSGMAVYKCAEPEHKGMYHIGNERARKGHKFTR